MEGKESRGPRKGERGEEEGGQGGVAVHRRGRASGGGSPGHWPRWKSVDDSVLHLLTADPIAAIDGSPPGPLPLEIDRCRDGQEASG